MRDREFLKSTGSSFSPLKVFAYVIFSRFIIIACAVFLLFLLAAGAAAVQGIALPLSAAPVFLLYLALTLFFLLLFLVGGALFGTLRSASFAVALVILVWAGMNVLIPEILQAVIEVKAQKIISNHRTDLAKLNIVTAFEKEAKKKHGGFEQNTIEESRKVIEKFWREDYLEIAAAEDRLRAEISSVVREYNSYALVIPSTFYQLTESELSSRGYGNFIAFHGFVRDQQRLFARFFIDRVFYNDPKVLVPFVKGDGNTWQGAGQLPANFAAGMALLLLYIAGLFLLGARRLEKWLHFVEDRKKFSSKDKNLVLESGKLNAIYSIHNGLTEQLYLVIKGRYETFKKSWQPMRKRNGEEQEEPRDNHFLDVSLDGKPITAPGIGKKEFLYIPSPGKIPGDIKTKDFISFFCRDNSIGENDKQTLLHSLKNIPDSEGDVQNLCFSQLEPHEKAFVLLSVLPLTRARTYLVDYVGMNMPVEILAKLVDQLETLAGRGAAVIYVTPDKRVEFEKENPGRKVYGIPHWINVVKAHKNVLQAEQAGK
jgi:hypothetical protein